MVLTEAIARGLPCIATEGVVATRHLPDGAVCIVPANDSARLSAAIGNLLHRDERQALSARAQMAAPLLQRWKTTAQMIVDKVRSVA